MSESSTDNPEKMSESDRPRPENMSECHIICNIRSYLSSFVAEPFKLFKAAASARVNSGQSFVRKVNIIRVFITTFPFALCHVSPCRQ